MPRPGFRRVLLVLAVAIVLLAVAAIVMVRRLQGPLAGPSRHDFGVVRIETPPALVEHTFRLVNRGGETLVLQNVKRSCNCATAEATPDILPPGATLDVVVTMKLSGATEKKSRITLIFDAGEREVIRNLFVKARGERSPS